jgi:hypothetical protein
MAEECDRRWHRHTVQTIVPANGKVALVIRVKSKWARPKDFFFDNIRITKFGHLFFLYLKSKII